jgi:hypothetical protein
MNMMLVITWAAIFATTGYMMRDRTDLSRL